MTVALQVDYGLTEEEIKAKGYTVSRGGYLLNQKGWRVRSNICSMCGKYVDRGERHRTNRKCYHKSCFERLLH